MTFETDRLVLRSFVSADKDRFYETIQDPRMYTTLPEDHMYNRDEVSVIIDWFVWTYKANTIENIVKLPLAIIEKTSGNMIGDIGIGKYSKDESLTEIFYCANSAYWNKGYISEAAKELLSYVRAKKLVSKLVGDVVIGNIASSKILLKNGFIKTKIDEANGSEIYELEIT